MYSETELTQIAEQMLDIVRLEDKKAAFVCDPTDSELFRGLPIWEENSVTTNAAFEWYPRKHVFCLIQLSSTRDIYLVETDTDYLTKNMERYVLLDGTEWEDFKPDEEEIADICDGLMSMLDASMVP